MKNDRRKALFVILLKDGKPEPGVWETWNVGAIGFRVRGLARFLRWEDEGVTWERAEEEK